MRRIGDRFGNHPNIVIDSIAYNLHVKVAHVSLLGSPFDAICTAPLTVQ